MRCKYLLFIFLLGTLFAWPVYGQDKAAPQELLPVVTDFKGFPADEAAYLTWTPFDTDTLDGYLIYRSTSSIFDSNAVKVDSLSLDAASYVDSGLDNWIPYSEFFSGGFKIAYPGEYYYWLLTVQGDMSTYPGEPLLVRPMPRSDEFGYTWSSNMDLEGETPAYEWMDIKEMGTQLILTGLDDVVEVPLDFEFPFYEWYFDRVFVNTHGMLSFTTATTQYWPPAFPYDEFFNEPLLLPKTSVTERSTDKFNIGDSDPMATLAVRWMDSDFGEDSLAYFWSDGQKAIIQYDRLPPYSELGKAESDTATFQVILYANGDFQYVYKEVGDYLYTMPASVGWQNHAGTDGLNIMYDTDGIIRDEMIVHVKNNYIAPTDPAPNVYVSDIGQGVGGFDKEVPGEDYYDGKITEMRWDGADARLRIKGEVNSPNILEIDYRTQKMYFADSPGGLRYSFLNDVPAKAVFGSGIYRSNLDGTELEAIFADTTGLSVPSDIKLDLKNDLIYWSEQDQGVFIRYNLGTSVMDTLAVSLPDAKFGFQILAFDIDFDRNRIFWSDYWSNGSIYMADLDTLETELLFENQYCTDIQVDQGYNYLLWVNANMGAAEAKIEGGWSSFPTQTSKQMYYSGVTAADLDSLEPLIGLPIPAEFLVTRMIMATSEEKFLVMGALQNEPFIDGGPAKSLMTEYTGYVGIWNGSEEITIIKEGMEWIAGGDFNLPPVPDGLSVVANEGYNELFWDPADNAYGYNVYKGTNIYPTSIVARILNTPDKFAAMNYVDEAIEGGETYYYRITEFTEADFNGNFSKQVSAIALMVPKVELSTETIDYGSLEVDSMEVSEFVIYSTGSDELIISSISLTNGLDFSLVDLAALPDTLAPGDTLAVNVQFLPSASGSFTDSVMIASNAAFPVADTLLFVKLMGEGTPPTDINDPGIPTEFAVKGNYPNPFNPSTNIRVDIPRPGNLEIAIFNILGQKVSQIYSGNITAGRHNINWNGKSSTGQLVSSGVYFYQVKYGEKQFFRKMTLLK